MKPTCLLIIALVCVLSTQAWAADGFVDLTANQEIVAAGLTASGDQGWGITLDMAGNAQTPESVVLGFGIAKRVFDGFYPWLGWSYLSETTKTTVVEERIVHVVEGGEVKHKVVTSEKTVPLTETVSGIGYGLKWRRSIGRVSLSVAVGQQIGGLSASASAHYVIGVIGLGVAYQYYEAFGEPQWTIGLTKYFDGF